MKKKEGSFFSWGNKSFLAIIIGVLSFGIYANTIPNSLNIDDELIYDNHILKGSDLLTLKKIFTEPYYKDIAGNKYEYRPMVLVSYFFEFLVFGRNPHVSHAINVLIYSVTCLVLFFLLLSLFRNYDFHLQVSFMVALLFAVHTIHTEAVASIKNRDELLSLLFSLIAWLFALRYVDSKKTGLYLLFLCFFLAGLFSKQTSITFSVLVPASIILFRKITFVQLLALILPIAMVSSIFSPIYLLYKKVLLFIAEIFFLILFYYAMPERKKLVEFGARVIRKVTVFLSGIISKTKKVVNQSVHIRKYSRFTHIRINSKLLVIGAFGLLLIVIGGKILSKKDKSLPETVEQVQWNVQDKIQDFNELQVTPALQTPAPAVVPIAGRKLNFAEVPLLYVENKSIKVGTSLFVLGQYLYLMLIPQPLRFYYGYGQIPLIGLDNSKVLVILLLYVVLLALMMYLLIIRKHLIAAFGLLFYLVSILPLSNIITPIAGIMGERLAYTASLGYCIALSYLLAYPVIVKKEKIFGLSNSTIVLGSRIFFTFVIIVYSYATVKRNFKWKDRLTLMRYDIEHLENSTRANHLLGTHLAYAASDRKRSNLPENKKMLQDAILHFTKALEIYPDFPYAWYDMAKTYLLLDDKESAIKAYLKSTQEDSLFAPSWFEMGVVLSERGRMAEAENAYLEAISRDSLLIEAYTNLSYLYYQQGKYKESLEVNLEALRHNPNSYTIYVNTGRIYLMLQDAENALLYLEKAVAINHSDKTVLNIIANLYQNKGNLEKSNYYRNLH